MSVFHSNKAITNYFQSFHYIYFVKLRNAHIVVAVFLRITGLSFLKPVAHVTYQ